MKTWKSYKKELLKKPGVKAEYDNLAPRYVLVSKLIDVRLKKGISQADLAKKMGTKQSAIARLESGRANPTMEFLEKLTTALGSKLDIQIR
jgi:ribosome-binding protein aMBF1 (putative translation factor)